MARDSYTRDTDRFEYLVIADFDNCGQEVKYTDEFDQPVAQDRCVSIKWERCPYCGTGPGWWDVTEEYEIERVLPTQERSVDTVTGKSGGDSDDA